jgi:hypothetical protein
MTPITVQNQKNKVNPGKASLQKLGLGKVAYYAWHRPKNRLRDCIAEGGPFQQRRTANGKLLMEQAAHSMPDLNPKEQAYLELHVLTGTRFWYQTVFCLWSFSKQANSTIAPFIYDDGTLTAAQRTTIVRYFPRTTFYSQSQILATQNEYLPAATFPCLRELWIKYPNIRKLTDPHIGSHGWKLVIDSDLLFFHEPSFLVSWIKSPETPLHAVDVTTSYGYPMAFLENLAGSKISEKVNVGLCGLNSDQLDWPRLEMWCQLLLKNYGFSYYLEQAIVAALLAGRRTAVAPGDLYVTLPRKPEATECTAIMHHYVAESKRWYFQYNWQTAIK